uniref:Ig-like domain-containing protein n=1 Tax=Echinococcus granulosus TaxID=6210 RepID=A0A068WCY7_ECHGR|nr:hypothetical protein EgrG_001074400 [Echinococcus granulosus]
MSPVQHVTKHCVDNLVILLLLGPTCCYLQNDLSRIYVYKYLMDEMPQNYICEGVRKLAEVEHEIVHCVVSGIRQTISVVDPKDIDIVWSPRAEAFSSQREGSIRFFLELKGKAHPYTWLKIRPAEKFGEKSPQIQKKNITWKAGIGGCFRYYIVSPFKAIAFTLKITKDFNWYPDNEYAVDTGSAEIVRYIQTQTGTKLKLQRCQMCSGRNGVTILQNYYVRFTARSSLAKDRIECYVEYEGNSTYFSTPVSIIRTNKLFYYPLFDSVYMKNVSKFPPKLDTLTDPRACKVESKTLVSSTNSLLNGVPGRYNVTCGDDEFSQSVLILSSRIFEIFYQKKTIPLVVKLDDSTLQMSDMDRYGCFWVTLSEMGEVVLNKRIDSSIRIVTIQCAAFVGPIAVRATLYHLLTLPTAIKIQLLYNRGYYLLGEHMDDIEVRASVGLIEIPSHDIHCRGKITFKSPFLKISSYTKEGTAEVSCFAKYKEQKGKEKHFRLHFLAQANFRLFTAKLNYMYIVRASYSQKPNETWINADPAQLAPQICNVHCISIHEDGPSFNDTIRIDEIKREFEVFDCYCTRTYKMMLIRRKAEFYFLLKRGLMLRGWQTSYEEACIIDTQSEIGLVPDDFYSKVVPVLKYRQMKGECPSLKCEYVTEDLNKYSLLYWNWHTKAVEFYSAVPYKRKLSYLDCYDLQVEVLNFNILTYPEMIEPSHNVIIPEIQQDLWVYMKDRKGLQMPVYRCFFMEMINLGTEPGHVTLRSYFTESFQTRLYCERVMNGDPVDIPFNFIIYPLNKLKVTIKPEIERIFVGKRYKFTCTSSRPELLQAYGSISMKIYEDEMVIAETNSMSINLKPGGGNKLPHIYSIRCLLRTASHYGELSRRDVTAYGLRLLVPKLKSIHRKAYFHNGDDEVNSRYIFTNEKLELMKELTASENSTSTGVKINVFYQSKQLFSHREIIPTIDIKEVKLQIEGAKKVHVLANRHSEEFIMCRVSGAEPLSADELQVKWSFSKIRYHPAPPLIEGAKIILNDKVGEGTFCVICTIPLLRSSTPINETCFIVIHAYRFNIKLIPGGEDGVYVLGSTNILRCSVSMNRSLMALDSHVPTCRLKALNENNQTTSNGAIKLGPNQKFGSIAIDIIISMFGIDVMVKSTTLWFIELSIYLTINYILPFEKLAIRLLPHSNKLVYSLYDIRGLQRMDQMALLVAQVFVSTDPTALKLQILNDSHIFDIRETGTITCVLIPENMTSVFEKHLQWIDTHTKNVVAHSRYNQLFIRSQEEMQRKYTCKFKIGNLKKDLHLKYFDLAKVRFTTNSRTVYDIYEKGHLIHCYILPEEMRKLTDLVWGWYDPVKKVHKKFIEVDTFEEGAHHLSCNSPQFSIPPLNITFYIVRHKAVHLILDAPAQSRYKRSDPLPKCIWSVPWMNKEPGLRPTLVRSGFNRGTIFRGRTTCTSTVPGLERQFVHDFRIIGLNDVRLQIVQDTGKTFFRAGSKVVFACTMVPSVSENIFESVLYWKLSDNMVELQQPFIDLSHLQPGKYNSSCWSSSLTIPVLRLFYIIGENAKLTLRNREKRTYLVGQQMPDCIWNEEWMNKLPELAPTTFISDSPQERRTIRTISCTFKGDDIMERYSESIIIVKKEELRLKLSESYAAVLKETPTIVCDLDPPIRGIGEPYFYPVREFGLAKIEGNRLIAGNSNSNSSNDLSSSPMISPVKREFVNGEEVQCSGTKDSQYGYYAIDVLHKDTNISLITKKQTRATLLSAFVIEIAISCTLRNSYLNSELEDKSVTLSAIVRPKKLINLKPGDRKYVDTSTVVHCAFDSTPKIGQHVTLNLFIYPLGYRNKVEKISLFSFKELGAIGGRYFFVCTIVNNDGPFWANIDEIIFLDTPAIPKISGKYIYGDQGLYCLTTEYPIWNRMLIASTESENGEIVRDGKGLYRFSRQSCYGYYNITCEVYGYYNLIAFYFRATYRIHYTGPEYSTKNAVDINRNDIIRIYSLFLLMVIILLILTFLALENYYRRQHISYVTKSQNYERFQSKALKGLQGQFLRIDLKDIPTDEALKFMTIVRLFDAAYAQVRPNFKRGAKKAKKTRYNWRKFMHLSKMAANNWMSGRILLRRRKIVRSSSEDSLETTEAKQSADK